MTLKNLVQLVSDIPDVRATWGENVQEMREAVTRHATDVVDQVVTAFDWDFTLDIADESVVSDQAEYELTGNRNDCRDIVNVKYGITTFQLLDKMTPIDIDEFFDGRTATAVGWWYISGRSPNGYPKITLVKTPDDADNTIRYRYRKNKIGLGDFPDEFSPVLVNAVVTRFIPAYMGIYEHELNKMIDRHSAPGGEDSPAKLNPWQVRRNNTTSLKHGYGHVRRRTE